SEQIAVTQLQWQRNAITVAQLRHRFRWYSEGLGHLMNRQQKLATSFKIVNRWLQDVRVPDRCWHGLGSRALSLLQRRIRKPLLSHLLPCMLRRAAGLDPCPKFIGPPSHDLLIDSHGLWHRMFGQQSPCGSWGDSHQSGDCFHVDESALVGLSFRRWQSV